MGFMGEERGNGGVHLLYQSIFSEKFGVFD